MPHIALSEQLPGITAGFAFRPETAKPMRELAHVLLFEPREGLTPAERELIAALVSTRNECHFCAASHGAAAAAHLGDTETVVQVCNDFKSASVSPKMRALLRIAAAVQQDGKRVTAEDVAAARDAGATDLDIHDTVLIAAALSMFNRYVDGLATVQPRDPEMYARMGEHLAREGYRSPSLPQSGTETEGRTWLKR